VGVVRLTRWQWGAGAGALLAAGLVLGGGWRAGQHYAARYAARAAGTIAAYLALVTPPARDGRSGYDLAPLLVQGRGLATLPGLGVEVEVYHGTAPLVEARGASLSPDDFDAIRRLDGPEWQAGRAVAPLKDQPERVVVGAVAARPRARGTPLLSPWLLGGLVMTLAAAWGAVRNVGPSGRRALLVYLAASGALGVGAYLGVRDTARRATDRWLMDARLLVQEVAARAPRGRVAVADLARVVRGATLSVAGPAATVPRRERSERGPEAVVAVRLGPGRWLELRAVPDEALARGWLLLLAPLALLGPGLVAVAHWGARTAARPRELRATAAAWGFLAPATVHIALFAFVPLLFVTYLAVHRWTAGDPVKPFVGLANFAELARDPLVWGSLRTTALFTLSVPISMVLALVAALVLHRGGRGAHLARTVLLLPALSSVVAMALLWQWVFHPDFGVLNRLSALVRAPAVDWLGDPAMALAALIGVAVWAQVGLHTIVFVVALQRIPAAYFDAARADGAGPWRCFWHVTLPMLRPVMLFVLVTSLIGAFQMFTLAYVLTGGGPSHATDVIAHRIYETAWGALRFGHASALAVLAFAVLFGVTWVQFRLLSGRRGHA
jgi:multiple sugar transport system permease protein